jgi:hypothetical protein
MTIDKRQQILLPSNAPAPDSITQIVSAGDATGDGKADSFLTVGDAFWVLIGYNGASVEQATQLSSSPWTERDIVTVQDVTGDGVADLIYRTDVTGRLLLRTGKAGASGGVDLNSLAAGANSAKGVAEQYGAFAWATSNIRLLVGTPDANKDNIPDIWTLRADGAVRFYAGTRGEMTHGGVEIVGNSDGGWRTRWPSADAGEAWGPGRFPTGPSAFYSAPMSTRGIFGLRRGGVRPPRRMRRAARWRWPV